MRVCACVRACVRPRSPPSTHRRRRPQAVGFTDEAITRLRATLARLNTEKARGCAAATARFLLPQLLLTLSLLLLLLPGCAVVVAARASHTWRRRNSRRRRARRTSVRSARASRRSGRGSRRPRRSSRRGSSRTAGSATASLPRYAASTRVQQHLIILLLLLPLLLLLCPYTHASWITRTALRSRRRGCAVRGETRGAAADTQGVIDACRRRAGPGSARTRMRARARARPRFLVCVRATVRPCVRRTASRR